MTMSERPFLSIGEVLDLLKDDFPDVTISKIRFLESQGLLDPERTPSGYRKFYEADVARLRWILEQQRDNFLPLKVIKDRLQALPAGTPVPESLEGEVAPAEPAAEPVRPAPSPAPVRPTALPAATEPAPAPPSPAPQPAAPSAALAALRSVSPPI